MNHGKLHERNGASAQGDSAPPGPIAARTGKQSYVPLAERKRWTKQEVLDEFKLSQSTYKRHFKSGLLLPMNFSGGDEYFEEDLLKALEESRRRGRI